MPPLSPLQSGRCGHWVFYPVRSRQLCRRYVRPSDPQLRWRQLFATVARIRASRLTQAQRDRWNLAAARVLSRLRLTQGPLSGQMFCQKINNTLARVGRQPLLEPPEPVAFPPNPVRALAITCDQGRLRLQLHVTGPVTADVLLFGQAPCSPRRAQWRHGAYLGLLPAPVDGLSDITHLYLAHYGPPQPGQRVFIRARQQLNGWEDHDHDLSQLVPARTLTPAKPVPSPPCRLWTLDLGLRGHPGSLAFLSVAGRYVG